MQILQLFNKVPYPPKDGGSIAVYNFSEGFAKAGHQIDLLCINTKKHFANISKIKDKLPENISIEAVPLNTDLQNSAALKNMFFSALPYIAERFISEEFEKKLIKTLQGKTYQLVQIEGLYMLPYAEVIRKYSSAKISYRAHNIEHEIWQLNTMQEKNSLKKLYLKHLSKRLKKFEIALLNSYDMLVPITARDAAIFQKLGNTKPMHVSPTGIEFANYALPEQDFSEIKLFHLGSLDWTPNIEGLLWFLKNVWTKLAKEYPDLKFTIAGRNASETFVQKITSYKNIVYKGEVEHALDFMHEHNVMIVPLLSGSGMRIKIIEGAACGNVIITTSKGLEGIDAKNNSEVLIADTAEKFIEQIKALLNDKKRANKISETAKHFISDNFDNFAISKSLLNFYLEIL